LAVAAAAGGFHPVAFLFRGGHFRIDLEILLSGLGSMYLWSVH